MSAPTTIAGPSESRSNESYPFCLDGISYDDGIDPEERKKRYREFCLESCKKGKADEAIEAAFELSSPIPLTPCDEELNFDNADSGSNVCFWVGMMVREWYDKRKQSQAPKMGKGQSISDLVPHAEKSRLKHDERALRVVAQKNGQSAQLYVLVRQDPVTKLCHGMNTSMDDVFIFPEYRDDAATAKDKRKEAWGAKIRDGQNKSREAKRDAARDYDKFKVIQPGTTKLQTEVASLW